MEEIGNSEHRFNENQKIKLYQFIASTEGKIEDDKTQALLDVWKQTLQNAQQKKQLRDLFEHKVLPLFINHHFSDEKLKKRFDYLKTLTDELCE